MTRLWGDCSDEEQVANANESFVSLAPVGEARADAVKAAWLPLQAGQTIPLIGEDRRYGDEQEE